MMELVFAGAGMATGILFGRYQLLRWNIESRKNYLLMIIGTILVFVPSGYLMHLYGYHILKMLRYWCLMYALLLLAILDSVKKIIPNKALLLLTGIRTVFLIGECICFPQILVECILSAAVGMVGGGLLFLLAGIISRNGIGMGDVKMIAVMGYYLGFQVLMSDLILIMTLTVLAGIAALVIKKASLRSEMPFAPFAALGTMFAIWLGV